MSFLPAVARAEYRCDFRIRITFNDLSENTIDFREWLDGPMFEPLKNPEYFQRFFVDGGTVAWPSGFFLQMNREAKGPAGVFRHTIIFGYDPVTKKHTGQLFDLTEGGSTSATIATIGNAWNWSGTGHTGTGKAFQERCTVNFATGGASWTLKCEVNTDGKTWSPTIDGKYTKSS